ncbi:rCG48573 [Rattus norvegicus]|uniref:RCG48573 n=1 Tax=Rattus norvegicus TaxID=10116 RepID=A6HZI5_RAT|nr:rCG48573 [Rattus norvegicus]
MAPLRPSRNMKQMPLERPSRNRNQRNNSLPLPSASDTVGTEGTGVQPSPHCRVSGIPRQPKSQGAWGPQEESLDKEAWALRSPTAGTLRRSWDKVVDRGCDWSERGAPGQGSCSQIHLSLRRRCLGDSPAKDGWPSARSSWGPKAHSLETDLG